MPRWIKSNPISVHFAAGNVDHESGIIRDVVMCEAGPAKGHGVHLEESFIAQLVAFDQKHYQESGIKARFGHPSLSDTTMGTQMGYFKNIRQRENQAIGDLHLLDSAEISPTKPGIKSWMLSMANEAEDFVMSSIVFAPSGYYQYSPEEGVRVDLATNNWGEPIPVFPEETIYVDLNEDKGGRHLYTDLVEAGAATSNLFAQQFNEDKFAVRTVAWLQDNPDILAFVRSNPNKIVQMCETLDIKIDAPMSTPQNEKSFFAHMMSFFNPEDTPDAETQKEVELAEKVEEVELGDTPDERDAQIAQLQQELADQRTFFTEQIESLASQVKEMAELSAADTTVGKKEPTEQGQRSWMDHPMNQKLRRQ